MARMGDEETSANVTRRVLLAGGSVAAGTWLAAPALAETAAAPRLQGTRFPVDLVLVEKGRRRLRLYYRDRVLKTYRVALGRTPVGHKVRRGDGRTPEGLYRIDLKKSDSRFGLALRVDYPNARDRTRAAALGVDPGGDIYVHGQPLEATQFAYFRLKFANTDWTDGCVALTNAEMAEVYAAVREGTPILIRA
jgi:murein L,D-transpeptidase YafK